MLIIDELGYLTPDSVEATLFFQLVSARYTRGSIVLTSPAGLLAHYGAAQPRGGHQ